MPHASIGRSVHVQVDPASNNGSDVAAAVIVRAWGTYTTNDGLGDRETVNVRVLLDQDKTLWLTSIPLFQTRPDSNALAAAMPHAGPHPHVAFWPPHV